MTAHQLITEIHRMAAGMRSAGVRPETMVGILAGAGHPMLLVARYAAHLLGAAVVHIRSANPGSDSRQLTEAAQADVLRATGARFLAADEAHIDRALVLCCNTSLVLVKPGEPESLRPICGDRATIAFTGGSGGRPKLVDQSFRMWQAMVGRLAQSMAITPSPTMLAVTPLSGAVGSMLDAALTRGGQIVLHERFDVSDVLRTFGEARVTDTYLTVPELNRLIDHPDVLRYDLSSLRRVVYSGTPAAPRRITQALRVFGDALVQVYGTTETSGICCLGPSDHRERELLPTVGRPLPWVEVRITDSTVWVRSETLMSGYLNDPATTDMTLRDGWLCTGDLGYLDRYGYLRLTGRVGNVIKTGGLKIYPASVERALLTHPDVTNAAVYAIRDLDRGEYVHAAIELRHDAACTPRQLSGHVAELLSPLHAPTAVTTWDRFPLNAAGKPDRVQLRTRPVTTFVMPA